MSDYIECSAFEVTQPVGSFYIAKISPEDLIKITFVDVRRIEKEERDVERVLGIQRPLSPNRVKEIAEYVNLYDASFPSSIIIAISSREEDDEQIRNVIFKKDSGILKIRRVSNVAKVLDGQHRIEGIRSLSDENKPFDLIITVFVDADIEQQAMLFATINKSQTKVNKSLVYDLFEFAKARSPEKAAHNIAILLNKKEGSPFKNRINILGKADDPDFETITQAAFVESLLKHITNNAINDRDYLRRNPDSLLPKTTEEDKYIFRDLFRHNQEAKIARVIWNYFSAVRDRWPTAWNSNERGAILNRSTGFLALMRLLKPIYKSLGKPNAEISTASFTELLNKSTLADADFTPDRFLPGSTGQGELFRTLCAQIGIKS